MSPSVLPGHMGDSAPAPSSEVMQGPLTFGPMKPEQKRPEKLPGRDCEMPMTPFSRLCTLASAQGDVPALGPLSAGVLEGLQKNPLLPSRHPPPHLHGHGVWGKR